MRWFTLLLLTASFGCSEPEAPPRLLQVPAFALTSQTGAPFGSEQLRGEVWIANFIFTRCPTICPMLTSQMQGLTDTLADTPVRFVSFSVDPTNDTPKVLAEYAERHGADTERWTFLTGDSDALQNVVVEGLRVRMGDEPDETGNILHGSHFVLIDGTRTIRGYYPSNADGLRDLATDARTLTRSR